MTIVLSKMLFWVDARRKTMSEYFGV